MSSSLVARKSTNLLTIQSITQLGGLVQMFASTERMSFTASVFVMFAIIHFLTNNERKIMFILKSILNQAGAVWTVESIAMRERDARRLLRRRQAQNDGSRRYGLFKA